jgi:NADH-quinone oxidoreductase subunit I
MIYEKQDLLAPLAEGMLAAPHPMVEGTTDTEYYRGTYANPAFAAAFMERQGAARRDEPTGEPAGAAE